MRWVVIALSLLLAVLFVALAALDLRAARTAEDRMGAAGLVVLAAIVLAVDFVAIIIWLAIS